MKVGQLISDLKEAVVTNVFQFFQAGRSIYIFLCGVSLLAIGLIVMIATFDSREAAAAPPGWERFVAATGSNQWVSCSFLIAGGCIVLSINYLPRLEGES
ncbi:hypothetical protein FOL47_001056 [Perkinsus chesapeaki]|uniref:Uncharacterized protein n=1 Tax=Perkinsus chesapeaki TaxID=330153 RepID=A0A7J6MK53_PERCH|nr:hypothetical protein FOL47_001056 [Perkinsus chesapeaki]